jgi:hypothetical protein
MLNDNLGLAERAAYIIEDCNESREERSTERNRYK